MPDLDTTATAATLAATPMLARVEALQCRVMYQCNNRCWFCLDRSEVDGDFHGGPRFVPRAHIERLLGERRAHVDSVVFTHGEPTLHPELIDFVGKARALGYRRIGLVSNGRRLADPAYARELLDAGLNDVVLSIHGDSPESHDAAVGRRAFHQTIEALRILAIARRERPLRLHTSTVVSHLNIDRIGEIVLFLLGFEIDTAVLNVVRPTGHAARYFDRVVPRYRDVVAALGGLHGLDAGARHRVAVEDIPPCVGRPIGPFLGVLEAWHIDRVAESPEASDAAHHPQNADTLGAIDVGVGDGNLVKRESCQRCVHDAGCWGVWDRYVAEYGWDEFVPITVVDGFDASTSPFRHRILQAVPVAAFASWLESRGTGGWCMDGVVLDELRGKALFGLKDSQGRRFRLGLELRDEARPAFRRTAVFNVFYQDRDELSADEATLIDGLCAWIEAREAAGC